MSLNLCKTVIDILKETPEKHFTARELAEEIVKRKPNDCQTKMEKSENIHDKGALVNQLVAEIGARRELLEKSNIKMTAERPRQYYYTTKTDEEEIVEAEKVSSKNKHPEQALYPLLCQYLATELKLYPKRIDEKTSSNSKGKNGNMWLHPDIVGLENLSKDWNDNVIKCANANAFNKTSLWSFEVKLKINLSNVRSDFFQTVANSSWANYSYLVAPEIDDKAINELRILCGRYKIGVIRLNKENPTESEILIPASERQTPDWDMINRIAKENSDFMNFINHITYFYQTGKLDPRDWDIPSKD